VVERLARGALESETFQRLGLDQLVPEEEDRKGIFKKIGINFRKLYQYRRVHTNPSYLPGDVLETMLDDLFGELTFERLKLRFIAVATDIYTGEDVYFREGSVKQAVLASASIPGVFPPVRLGDRLLVDGGVSHNIPTPDDEQARNAPHPPNVVAVDVQGSPASFGEFERGSDVLARTDQITSQRLNEFYLERADLVLKPDVGDHHWADFGNLEGLLEAGRAEVAAHEAELERLFA
jgi:NTE family protein